MPERLINVFLIRKSVPRLSLHPAPTGLNGKQLFLRYSSGRKEEHGGKEEQSQGVVCCQAKVLQSVTGALASYKCSFFS